MSENENNICPFCLLPVALYDASECGCTYEGDECRCCGRIDVPGQASEE